MSQSLLNILYVEVVLRQIADTLILKVDSGPYPQECCWLLVFCCITLHLLSVPGCTDLLENYVVGCCNITIH